MYRACFRGLRPCVWTVVLVLLINLIYRVLLLLEGQGTLARHGFHFPIPKIKFRTARKSHTATIPMDFFISEKNYCKDRSNLLAVAIISSRLDDFELRQETRQTWGSAEHLGVPFGMLFLLGRPTSREQKQRTKQESQQYGDIVQGDYDDQLQVSKSLNGLLWLALNCALVPFTIHASDKVLLDIFLLQSFLWEILQEPEKTGMIFGKLTYEVPAEEQNFSSSSGWSMKSLRHMVPEVTHLSIEHYPPYLDNSAWFGRTQSVVKLLGASSAVPLVTHAGLYTTGLLLDAASLHRSPDLFNTWLREKGTVLPEDIGLVIAWFLDHEIERDQRRLWELIIEHHQEQHQIVRRREVLKNTRKKDPSALGKELKSIISSNSKNNSEQKNQTKSKLVIQKSKKQKSTMIKVMQHLDKKGNIRSPKKSAPTNKTKEFPHNQANMSNKIKSIGGSQQKPVANNKTKIKSGNLGKNNKQIKEKSTIRRNIKPIKILTKNKNVLKKKDAQRHRLPKVSKPAGSSLNTSQTQLEKGSNVTVAIQADSVSTDARRKAFLIRKKQLQQMIRPANVKHKITSNISNKAIKDKL